MDIIEPDLDWVVNDDGSLTEINSDLREYYISETNLLEVFHPDGSFIQERQCVDTRHAEHMAEAHECVAMRNIARGETWRGKSIDEYGYAK